MDINDVVGWLGLILALVALPPIWTRIAGLWAKYRAAQRGFKFDEVLFQVDWHPAGSGITVTNVRGMSVRDLRIGLNTTNPQPVSAERLAPNESVDAGYTAPDNIALTWLESTNVQAKWYLRLVPATFERKAYATRASAIDGRVLVRPMRSYGILD